MQITLYTDSLLDLVKANKEKHIKEYKLQIKGWQVAMEKFSQELNDWAINGARGSERPTEPFKPVDYTEEYDIHIDYLENHVLGTITLDEYEYKQLFKDDWGWKSSFNTANLAYNSNFDGQ